MPIIAKAMKPLPVALFAACSMLGAKRSETVMVGDQLSTDVLAAHNAGMSAYLLAPLGGAGPAAHEVRAHGGAGHLGGAVPEGAPQPVQAQRGRSNPRAQNALARDK